MILLRSRVDNGVLCHLDVSFSDTRIAYLNTKNACNTQLRRVCLTQGCSLEGVNCHPHPHATRRHAGSVVSAPSLGALTRTQTCVSAVASVPPVFRAECC